MKKDSDTHSFKGKEFSCRTNFCISSQRMILCSKLLSNAIHTTPSWLNFFQECKALSPILSCKNSYCVTHFATSSLCLESLGKQKVTQTTQTSHVFENLWIIINFAQKGKRSMIIVPLKLNYASCCCLWSSVDSWSLSKYDRRIILSAATFIFIARQENQERMQEKKKVHYSCLT